MPQKKTPTLDDITVDKKPPKKKAPVIKERLISFPKKEAFDFNKGRTQTNESEVEDFIINGLFLQ